MDLRESELDIGGLGGFVDTVGSSRRELDEEDSHSPHRGDQTDKLKDKIEDRLEGILFGKQPLQSKNYFTGATSLNTESDEGDEDYDTSGPPPDKSVASGRLERQPAWHDQDDDQISIDITAHTRTRKLRQSADEKTISGMTYSKRLRSQYEKILGHPEWARRAPRAKKKRKSDEDSCSSDSSDEEDGVLRRTGNLLATSTTSLPKGILDLKRMADANKMKRTEAVVRALEFHPTASVILVAGHNKSLDLFQVDGQTNPKLQSIHVPKLPISTAHFTQDGKEVVLAGRKRTFYVYDMVAGKVTPIFGIRGRDERYFEKFVVSPDNQYLVFLGKNGYLLLVSNKTKQWIGELKMSGNVCDVSFTSDSRYMLSSGSEGKVYVWDMSARKCVHCFVDEGCIIGTSISISSDSHYVASGSECGVVNIYTGNQCLSADGGSTPKPLKSLMNLTTGIGSICINSTSEVMVIASQRKKDALKMVHLPSQTVFSNWPVRKTPLGYVTALAISPLSKYLAIGNAKGRVLLYRFNHYYNNST